MIVVMVYASTVGELKHQDFFTLLGDIVCQNVAEGPRISGC